MSRGRSTSPRTVQDADVDMENGTTAEKQATKIISVTNLTRNVVESHLRTVFGFYGEIIKLDLPLFGKSGQNRGKAALEYADASEAQKAVSHMDGGQLDGAILKIELSDTPIRTRSPAPRSPPPPRSPRRGPRNGRDRPRSFSRSRTRSRSPPYRRRGYDAGPPRRGGDSYRGRGGFGRRGPPPRDTYRPYSRSRSRSPVRGGPGGGGRLPPRRRSPSYERGGTGAGRGRGPRAVGGRSRSRSYSVRSSRSRSRSYSRSRTRSRSRSYSSYSRRSSTRSRSRSASRGRRSVSDIRDSRSRSPAP